MTYPVTTIGEVVETICCSSCEGGAPCAANDTSPPKIGALEDVTILINPLAWGVQKVFGALVSKVTGEPAAPAPSSLDHMAKALGVRPIELAVGLTGYTGLGRYETAAKVIGGATVLGVAAYYVARRVKSKRKKGKRG